MNVPYKRVHHLDCDPDNFAPCQGGKRVCRLTGVMQGCSDGQVGDGDADHDEHLQQQRHPAVDRVMPVYYLQCIIYITCVSV